MTVLLAFPVALPLAAAALIALTDGVTPDWAKDFPGMFVAAATTVVSTILLVRSEHSTLVEWFGGWHPRHGVAIGVGFAADPIGAGMAALVGVLVTFSLVYSWRYMDEAPRLYRVLVLVFLGGMSGFALSGDLFNMFVWFELMGVAAYALAGYMVEETGPLQGALNFAITNSIGAYMILFGIGLLYGRTGALNLAQMGAQLAHRKPDGLVVEAFTLVAVGFLVKAAVVPFHLWLADAHAVAPAPVCVLFSGVMVELGLLGLARVYWTAFSGPFGAQADGVRMVLIVLGIVTALLGATMCMLERHLKRLLAYSTISHAGMMLVGIGLLSGMGLAGSENLVLSHAFLKGALFLICGILLRVFRSVDELNLHGKGLRLPFVGSLYGLAAFGLIGFPYVGAFLGHSLIDDASISEGHEWIPPLVMIAAGISAGAILRSWGRVFHGWGPKRDPLLTPEPGEEPPEEKASIPIMATVTAVMVAIGLGLSLAPGLKDHTERAGERFRDRHAYIERVLHGHEKPHTAATPDVLHAGRAHSIGYGIGGFLIAVAAALFGLYRGRLPQQAREWGTRLALPPLNGLRALHSGVPGDYVMWISAGAAALGGIWALALHA
jgi:multicomponent Na+:H+ antiporter subunit D